MVHGQLPVRRLGRVQFRANTRTSQSLPRLQDARRFVEYGWLEIRQEFTAAQTQEEESASVVYPQLDTGREVHQRTAVRICRPGCQLRRSQTGSGGVQVPLSGGRARHSDAVPGVDQHRSTGRLGEWQCADVAKHGHTHAG